MVLRFISTYLGRVVEFVNTKERLVPSGVGQFFMIDRGRRVLIGVVATLLYYEGINLIRGHSVVSNVQAVYHE